MTVLTVNCQVHQVGINYQAVARNAQGIELASTSLGVRFSILLNNPNGTVEWEETDNVTTNSFGLFTVIIGQGDRQSGTAAEFDSIQWGNGVHYLKVEVNFGSGYTDLGTTQMTAVPYAMYADRAGNAATNGIDTVAYDSLTYILTANGKPVANLSGLKNKTVQNLNLNGNFLSLSQSPDTINLSKYTYTPQNLTLNGNTLSLSLSEDTVNLSKYIYTPPSLVAFSVSSSSLIFSEVNPQAIPFYTKIYDNTSSFNTTKFTAPAAGTYFFSISLVYQTTYSIVVTILKNGSTFQLYPSINQQTFSATFIMDLSAKDSVSVQITNTYAPINLANASFSGYMIH